jgi:hypothetical protein
VQLPLTVQRVPMAGNALRRSQRRFRMAVYSSLTAVDNEPSGKLTGGPQGHALVGSKSLCTAINGKGVVHHSLASDLSSQIAAGVAHNGQIRTSAANDAAGGSPREQGEQSPERTLASGLLLAVVAHCQPRKAIIGQPLCHRSLP